MQSHVGLTPELAGGQAQPAKPAWPFNDGFGRSAMVTTNDMLVGRDPLLCSQALAPVAPGCPELWKQYMKGDKRRRCQTELLIRSYTF